MIVEMTDIDVSKNIPSRTDSTASTSSTSSTSSRSSTWSKQSTHIVYNPQTFKLEALGQDEFDKKEGGLIPASAPGRSLDADIYMNIGGKQSPVKGRFATVDIGNLGWIVSIQRLLGMHPEIYILA